MNDHFIVIAKVGAVYGIKSDLKLHILATSYDKAISYKPWFIQMPETKEWAQIEDYSTCKHGNKTLIHFNNVIDHNGLHKYIHALIGVKRDQLDDLLEDEYYWADMVGMSVHNSSGSPFGKVQEVIATGANDVLICKFEKKEYLIPFISQYVLEVNYEQKKIIVEWEYDYL